MSFTIPHVNILFISYNYFLFMYLNFKRWHKIVKIYLIIISGLLKKHKSSELLNQSKIFSKHQKSFDSVCDYDTLTFKKAHYYTPLVSENIFKINSFVTQEPCQKNKVNLKPVSKKVFFLTLIVRFFLVYYKIVLLFFYGFSF